MGSRDEAVKRTMTVIQTLLQTGMIAAGSALFPFLNLPVIKQVFSYMAGKIAAFMVERGEFGAFSYMIDERIDAQTKQFFDKAMALNLAIKSGDPNVVKQAEIELIRASDSFFSLRS